MARGWESKSVESQIESANDRGRLKAAAAPAMSAAEVERQQQIEHLQMARIKTVHDLETAQNPRYRVLLESTLRHLESRIEELSRN